VADLHLTHFCYGKATINFQLFYSTKVKGLRGLRSIYRAFSDKITVLGRGYYKIKHTIRSKDGGIKTVSLSPIKAIRHQCLECMGWSAHDADHCTDKLCSLFPYRFGNNPECERIGGELSSK
jgi:hypothetical protein